MFCLSLKGANLALPNTLLCLEVQTLGIVHLEEVKPMVIQNSSQDSQVEKRKKEHLAVAKVSEFIIIN